VSGVLKVWYRTLCDAAKFISWDKNNLCRVFSFDFRQCCPSLAKYTIYYVYFALYFKSLLTAFHAGANIFFLRHSRSILESSLSKSGPGCTSTTSS